MSLRFHWFLPTNGDSRDIVAGGHGVATGAAGAIRLHTISRDTSADAWRQAGYLLDRVTDEMVGKVQAGRRTPNPTASSTSLVGSHEEVANLIEEYASASRSSSCPVTRTPGGGVQVR